MHFMNPVPVMPLVEIVRGIATSDAVRPNPSLINPAPQTVCSLSLLSPTPRRGGYAP